MTARNGPHRAARAGRRHRSKPPPTASGAWRWSTAASRATTAVRRRAARRRSHAARRARPLRRGSGGPGRSSRFHRRRARGGLLRAAADLSATAVRRADETSPHDPPPRLFVARHRPPACSPRPAGKRSRMRGLPRRRLPSRFRPARRLRTIRSSCRDAHRRPGAGHRASESRSTRPCGHSRGPATCRR